MSTRTLHQTPPGVDARAWPDVASLPRGGLGARVARRLFARVCRRLDLVVEVPGGPVLGGGGPDAPRMQLRRPDSFYRRLAAGGLIGFGESYMAGDWEAGDLTGVLTAFARELTTLIPPRLQRLRDLYVAHHPAQEQGSPEGARRNIARHYDLSNDLFASFLDPTMTYSSALFPSDPPAGGWDELAAAQQRKIDRLLDKVGVREGTELVEIGTGWGELALRAAARGARVTSVTLSEEQRALALRRIADAGLADRVRVELRDYRDVTGSYDALVSVEMIEAVGYRYWPTYFATIDRLLRPGGRAGLQAITMPHDRMMASRDTYTWIHKYIFPGGLIPSVQSVTENVGRQPGLRIVDAHAFGAHYAATLRLWRERFDAAAPEVAALGFDDTFRRMWRLYLAYSEAGFRSGYLDVYQFVLAKGERA